jgi:hypothetical protein
MTRKELNIAIFEKNADAVLWQPRLETWTSNHRIHGTMPDKFAGLSDLEIYDKLGCSVRYAASTGIDRYYESDNVVALCDDSDPKYYREIIRAPEGELVTIFQNVWQGEKLVNRRIVKFPVTTGQDLKVVTAVVQRYRYRSDLQAFQKAAATVGNRAEPTLFANSDGYTELVKFWSGLEMACYLLVDHPKEMDAYIEACNHADDRQFDALFELPCRIFNLGDHTTNEFTPPPIIEKYCLARWQRITKRATEHNRFIHSHWDGNARHILRYLRASGLHGVEALTPEPMGDMSLEMIKDAVGDDLVVLDLVPAIFFLPNYPMNDMLEFTRKVIDMFAPRLVLGVSDEISQIGEIERIEAISELVDKVCGLAE